MKNKMHITEIYDDLCGKFAVFRHSSAMKAARFTILKDTYEDAAKEAIRLTAEATQAAPDVQFYFYVVRVCSMFSGGPKGLSSKEL